MLTRKLASFYTLRFIHKSVIVNDVSSNRSLKVFSIDLVSASFRGYEGGSEERAFIKFFAVKTVERSLFQNASRRFKKT